MSKNGFLTGIEQRFQKCNGNGYKSENALKAPVVSTSKPAKVNTFYLPKLQPKPTRVRTYPGTPIPLDPPKLEYKPGWEADQGDSLAIAYQRCPMSKSLIAEDGHGHGKPNGPAGQGKWRSNVYGTNNARYKYAAGTPAGIHERRMAARHSSK